MLGVNNDNAKRTPKTQGVEPFPLHLPHQEVALVQIAHKDLDCRTTSGRAGFRVLGIFANESKAKKHFKKCIKRDLIQKIPGFVVNLFETNVIPSNASRSVEYLSAKTEKLKADHKTMMEERKQLFEENLKKRKNGDLDTREEVLQMMKDNELEKEEVDDADADDDNEAVKRDAEIRNQQFVAVSCLIDKEEENEDAFTIYGAFAREDDAKRYINDTLSDHDNSIHLFVCDMYEWLFPYILENPKTLKNMPFSYHHDQLNSFMQFRASQKERVAAFKKHMEKQPEIETLEEGGEEGDDEGAQETKS